MLPTVLPLTPFVIPIKSRWEDGQEKKKRTIKIDPDKYFEDTFSQSLSGDEDDLSSLDSSESSEYTPSVSEREEDDEEDFDFLDNYADFVNKELLPAEAVVGQAPPKLELYKPPETTGGTNAFGFVDRAWARFQAWCEHERERRKHYILRDYETKVKNYESKLQEELSKEIEKMKKDVMKEAVKLAKLRKINSMSRPVSKHDANKKAAARYLALCDVRDEEKRRMDFLVNNLQRWAVEKHDQKIRDEELRLAAKKEAEQREAERQRKARVAQAKLDDAAVYAEDTRMTQEWLEAARRVGVLAGTNPPVKLSVVESQDLQGGFSRPKKEPRVRVALKPDFDHRLLLKRRDPALADAGGDEDDGKSAAQKRREKMSTKAYTPFDTDLSKTAHVTELCCVGIGERGALSLAAELLRGATPSLDTLDLSRCQIQTRGFGRLLHSIKLANLMSLRTFILRGNDIGPRGLQHLMLAYSSGCMADLQVLDLRENEVGDAGADTLMRMIVAGYMMNLRQLHLQHNNIGDVGFVKLVKVLQSMQSTKMPRLERLGMELNPISASAKRQYAPLAAYWSL